jgi:Predicted membrane protein (DUF2157)
VLGLARGVRQHSSLAPAELQSLLDRWVAAGLITSQQAERIRDQEAGVSATAVARSEGTPDGSPATSLMTEAVGYLGGVLIVVAAGLLTARMWSELSLSTELLLVAAIAAVLLAAGALVPDRRSPPGSRLCAVLWLLSTVAFSALLVLVANQGLGWRDEDVAVLAAGGTAIYALALWWRHRHVVQQGVLLVSLVVAAAAATAELGGPEQLPGLAVVGVGASWFALGWSGRVGARRPAYLLGAGAAMFGALILSESPWGQPLALATVAAILFAAVRFRDLALLAIAAIGALQVLPRMTETLFPNALAAPIALMVAGGLLVAAALYTARRGGGRFNR